MQKEETTLSKEKQKPTSTNYLMKKKAYQAVTKAVLDTCLVDAGGNKPDFVKSSYPYTSFSTGEPSTINDSNNS